MNPALRNSETFDELSHRIFPGATLMIPLEIHLSDKVRRRAIHWHIETRVAALPWTDALTAVPTFERSRKVQFFQILTDLLREEVDVVLVGF